MQLASRLNVLVRSYASTIVFLVLMLMFRSAFADWMVVPSGSMNPTIIEGDRVLVDKHVFGVRVPFTTVRMTRGENPQRGDIVVFDSPTSSITLIKRVIGLPGDVIEMHNDKLFINQRALAYLPAPGRDDIDLLQVTGSQEHVLASEKLPGREHDVMVLPERAAMRDFPATVVAAGHYFMMGDNRDNSGDSRYIGSIARDAIIGRASRVLISLDPEHYHLPREDRFLKPLS